MFDRLDADDIKALEDLEKIDDEINQNISSFFDKCNKDEFENLNKITSFYVTFKTELAKFEFKKISDLQTDMEVKISKEYNSKGGQESSENFG
jgi:trans-2-enoyl-CoA reductase